MFYMTSRAAKTVRRTSWGLGTSDRYFDEGRVDEGRVEPVQKLWLK